MMRSRQLSGFASPLTMSCGCLLAFLVMPFAPRLGAVQPVVMDVKRVPWQHVLQQEPHEAVRRAALLLGLAALVVLVLEHHVLAVIAENAAVPIGGRAM
jgi:hypothetical protein